jgi:transposase
LVLKQLHQFLGRDHTSGSLFPTKSGPFFLAFTNDHKIVNILEDRRLVYLREYFDKIQITVRKIVKYVVCDMYDGYITIAHEYFPNAIVAIDPYNYIEYMTNAAQ